MSYSKANIELLFPYATQAEVLQALRRRNRGIINREMENSITELVEDFKPIKVNKAKVERTAGMWAFSRYSISKYSM